MRIFFSQGEVFDFTHACNKWQMLASFQKEHQVPSGGVLRCWRKVLRQDVDSIVLSVTRFTNQDAFSFKERSERKHTWHRAQRYHAHLSVWLQLCDIETSILLIHSLRFFPPHLCLQMRLTEAGIQESG